MNNSPAPIAAHRSLRRQLPLLISALVALVLGTFLWTAVRRVEATLVQAAGDRAQSAADQVASLLDGSRMEEQARAVAGNPVLHRFVETRTADARAAVEAQLQALVSDTRRVELWDATGSLLLELPGPGASDELVERLPRGGPPSEAGISPLQSAAGTVFADIVAPVDGGGEASIIGYLRIRSTIAENPPGIFSRLVGQAAAVRVGNTAGDLWTDFSRSPSVAMVDLSHPGVSQYQTADGELRVGAARPVVATPWAAWVDFPVEEVVAPARLFLRRMLLVGLGFVAVAAALAVAIAARITTPLSELSTAAAAIAAGDYTRRVGAARRDEIGQLAATFNRMAADIQTTADALRTSEDSYRRLFASNPHPMWVYDVETLRFLDVNDMAVLHYGFSRDEFLSMTLKDIRLPADLPKLLDYVARPRTATGEDSGVWRHRKKNGDLIDVEISSHPLVLDGRQACAVLVHDVTERLKVQHALRDSEARFRGMAEAMPHIVWTARPDGTVEYFNRRWFEYTGLGTDEAQPTHWRDRLHPDDRDEVMSKWARALATGEALTVAYRLRSGSSGEYRWHTGRAAPLTNDRGEIVMWVGTSTDVNDQRRDQEALRQLNAELEVRVAERTSELEAANRELESFSYSVSHDLRAPLRHVQGYVEMLTMALKGNLSDTPKRYLQTITDATVEMGQLIDDLLSFSRMGRVQMSQGQVSLTSVVEACVSGLEVATRGRNIVWKIGALPEVLGDPSMLKQVYANLLDNAVKYTRGRDPAVIEVGCAGEVDGRAVLFVRDNGAGFDMQYANKLFGVFQRLHRADEFEGTGIGLATVRRIITRHGGRTWAEGQVNQGATVYFTIQPATPIPATENQHA